MTARARKAAQAQASIVPIDGVNGRILSVRGERVILDADLAELYGVSIKAVHVAVRRNPDRFPPDFVFRLTPEERTEVAVKSDHLRRLKYSTRLPYVFTEPGAIMVAGTLFTEQAVAVSVTVVRVFARLRPLSMDDDELARRLEALERKCDQQFTVAFDTIAKLVRRTTGERGAKRKRQNGFVKE